MTAPHSVLRRFTSSFHPRSAELLVYGGFACGMFLLLLAFMTANLIFLLPATAGLLSAYYFYPFLDTTNAQLGADTTGLYIRGLGFIPWSAVDAFRVLRIHVRSVETARLQVKLVSSWQSEIQCEQRRPLYLRLMYTNWKKKSGDMVEVRLEHLKDSSRTIEKAVTEIWQNRPVSAKAPVSADTPNEPL